MSYPLVLDADSLQLHGKADGFDALRLVYWHIHIYRCLPVRNFAAGLRVEGFARTIFRRPLSRGRY